MILITGGAGFIGSVLVKALNERGHHDIVIVDRLKETSKWKNLRNLKFDRYIHVDDFFTPENEDLFQQFEIVFHMGACSSTTQMDMDFLNIYNVEYSKNLFGLCSALNIPFIYASSAATYGAGEHGYSDEHAGIEKLRPLNPYGYSKQLFDEWALRQEATPPLWFGLKFFNVFGPNEYHKEEMRSLVHKAYQQINETGKVKLFKSHKEGFEDGKQLRDFIYVKDVVRAMLELAQKTEGSGVYNLGTGEARSFYDLVVATFNSMERKVDIEYIDMPESIRGQYQYFTQADMSKFKKLCPEFNFSKLENAVKDYVEHLNNEDPHL